MLVAGFILILDPNKYPVEFFILMSEMFPDVPVTKVIFIAVIFVVLSPVPETTCIVRFNKSAEEFVLI